MNARTARHDRHQGRPRALRHLLHPLAFLQRGQQPEALPITLDRRRIFIVPSSFGAGFAVVLGVMFLGALNYSNNSALLLTALLAAATGGSMLATFRALNRLRLTSVRADPVHAGKALTLTLELDADGLARHALHLDGPEQVQTFDLPAEHPAPLQLDLPTRQRGWMQVPRLRVHSNWPFGMFRAWAWLRPDTRLLVYPHPEPEGPPPQGIAAHHSAARNQKPLPGDQQTSLRAYHHGDPVKLVAWKASARHENLLVREFEQPSAQRPWMLNWSDTANLDYEARIARLTRWVEDAHAAQARWTLRLPDQTLGPDAGTEHRHRCLQALALLP